MKNWSHEQTLFPSPALITAQPSKNSLILISPWTYPNMTGSWGTEGNICITPVMFLNQSACLKGLFTIGMYMILWVND